MLRFIKDDLEPIFGRLWWAIGLMLASMLFTSVAALIATVNLVLRST